LETVKIDIKNHSGQTLSYSIRKGMGLVKLRGTSKELEFDCLKGDCGVCIVRVRAGQDLLSPPSEVEADFLKAMQAERDERLACQCRAFGDVILELENFDP